MGISVQEKNGTLLLIHVVGVAGLTLLVNAPTAPAVLNYLGMTEPSLSHKVAVKRIKGELDQDVIDFARKLIQIQNDDGYTDFKITEKELSNLCHILKPKPVESHELGGEMGGEEEDGGGGGGRERSGSFLKKLATHR